MEKANDAGKSTTSKYLNKKPLFFTSDWHIGHAKAIEYDKRPFRDLSHMHETLIARYNSTVPENGVCYFIGDMGNRPEDVRQVISRLRGTKVLILGNHDPGMGTMYNCGFDVVVHGLTLYLHDKRVTLTHCPFMGVFREDTRKMRGQDPLNPENWHGERRKAHSQCSTKDEGQFHLHGHIHSRKDKPESQKILDRQFDVGVTANNYTPVSVSQIESWIMKYGR